jgi:hypothetical protein
MSKAAVKTRWTDEQIKVLRELYPLGAIDEICMRLGRSRQAVKHAAITHGLSGKYHWRGTKLPVDTEVHRRGKNSYVMVKVLRDDGKQVWMRKHHLVWKEATGSLPPEGMRIGFRDGDRANCAFENLELRHQVETARYMTRFRSYPPELQEAIRLLSKVRQALYERAKHGRYPGAPGDRFGPTDGPIEADRFSTHSGDL